ncbi:CHST1 [Mytilus coruscus]|uniref:CHST1 n=1 Tax=Mytilus coruscus TaxID=42192 RepID=A0A6J8BPE7_MYTCO|nr:CHST1 [Mytilus coruscus]
MLSVTEYDIRQVTAAYLKYAPDRMGGGGRKKKPVAADNGYYFLLDIQFFKVIMCFCFSNDTVSKRQDCYSKVGYPMFQGKYNLKNNNVSVPPQHKSVVTTGVNSSVVAKPMGTKKVKTLNVTVYRVNKILLASYMRSGSTFSSDLIYQNRGVFLIFEPFWHICRWQTKPIHYTWDAICRNSEEEIRNLNKISDVLHDMFMCNLFHLPAEILKSLWFFQQGTGYAILNKCYQFYKNRQDNVSAAFDSATKGKCIRNLEAMCKNSSTILIKTIRLSFDQLLKIVTKIPELKVVHLVRDPRAILHSREEAKQIDYRHIRNESHGLCFKMANNINIGNHLMKEKVFFLKYECLAANPVIIAKTLYSFLNLRYTRKIDSWLITHTQGDVSSFDRKFIAHVANSRLVSLKWIYTVPKDVLKLIDKECRNVYKSLRLSDSQTILQKYTYINKFNMTKVYDNMCNE